MPDTPPPENTPPAGESSPDAPTETPQQDQDFTPEWKQSVEDRFSQIGDALKAFSTRRSTGGHPATQRTQQATAPSAGAAGGGSSTGQAPTAAGAPPPSGDTRAPKNTHWWYRKLGE